MMPPKKVGRPRQLRSPRVPTALIKRVDSFTRRRDAANRSEAVRYLLAFALDEVAKQDQGPR